MVLLDNMDTETLRTAVALVDGRMVTEASGNMNLARIAEVAATGVDYISVGRADPLGAGAGPRAGFLSRAQAMDRGR